jgi:Domain of unknown function (DUF4397)
MKRALLLAMITFCLALSASHTPARANSQDGLLRVAHLIYDQQFIDIYVDNNLLWPSLDTFQISSYLTFPPSTATIIAVAVGGNPSSPLASLQITFVAGETYTAIFYDSVSQTQSMLIEETLLFTQSGLIERRDRTILGNFVQDTEVDALTGGDTILAGMPFSNFLAFSVPCLRPSADAKTEYRVAGTETDLVELSGIAECNPATATILLLGGQEGDAHLVSASTSHLAIADYLTQWGANPFYKFRVLIDLLKTAGLYDGLIEDPGYIFVVPSDKAFVGQNVPEIKEGANLADRLMGLMAKDRLNKAALDRQGTITFTTLSGGELTFSQDEQKQITVNGVPVAKIVQLGDSTVIFVDALLPDF